MVAALAITCPDRIYNGIAWDRTTQTAVTFPVAGLIDAASQAAARSKGGKKNYVNPLAASRGGGRGGGGRETAAVAMVVVQAVEACKHSGYESDVDLYSNIHTDMHILNNITTRHNTHINEHTIPIRLFSKEGMSLTLQALVDTVKLQGNYISGAAYALIEEYGFVQSVHNIRVCAAFNDCQYSTISITLPCNFNYNLVKLQPFVL